MALLKNCFYSKYSKISVRIFVNMENELNLKIAWEDNLNGRQTQFKMTLMEDDPNRRQPQRKITPIKEKLNGRQTQCLKTSIEDNCKEDTLI